MMLNLNLYKTIYEDCQKLQSKWLGELGSFFFSNRADFEPTADQRSKMQKELDELLNQHFANESELTDEMRFGLRLHFEARILSSIVEVSKTLFIYYSPEINTVFSFIKIMNAIFYDQMRKNIINLDNISEILLMDHIKAINSISAKPFEEAFLSQILVHYLEEFALPLKQAKLPLDDRYKDLSDEDLDYVYNPFKCIKMVILNSFDHDKGGEVLNTIRESKFTFSKNSWDKVDKRPEISDFIAGFCPEENSNMLTIVLPSYKPLVKSNINNLLNKIGLVYRIAVLSGRDAESNIQSDHPFNEAHHVQVLFSMFRNLERLQFIVFDQHVVKENTLPLGGIGCLYEIISSHFFRNYEFFSPNLILNEVALTATFNPQTFTRTLFNNSCLISPLFESVDAIYTSMDYYTNMYQKFFHQNDIKDMAGTYIRLARIPDIILNRHKYSDKKNRN